MIPTTEQVTKQQKRFAKFAQDAERGGPWWCRTSDGYVGIQWLYVVDGCVCVADPDFGSSRKYPIDSMVWSIKATWTPVELPPARSPVRIVGVKTCRDHHGRHSFHFELSDGRTVETTYKRAYWWMAGNMRRIIEDPLKSELERVCARGELHHAVETLRQIDRWVKDGCGWMILRKVPRQ